MTKIKVRWDKLSTIVLHYIRMPTDKNGNNYCLYENFMVSTCTSNFTAQTYAYDPTTCATEIVVVEPDIFTPFTKYTRMSIRMFVDAYRRLPDKENRKTMNFWLELEEATYNLYIHLVTHVNVCDMQIHAYKIPVRTLSHLFRHGIYQTDEYGLYRKLMDMYPQYVNFQECQDVIFTGMSGRHHKRNRHSIMMESTNTLQGYIEFYEGMNGMFRHFAKKSMVCFSEYQYKVFMTVITGTIF